MPATLGLKVTNEAWVGGVSQEKLYGSTRLFRKWNCYRPTIVNGDYQLLAYKKVISIKTVTAGTTRESEIHFVFTYY